MDDSFLTWLGSHRAEYFWVPIVAGILTVFIRIMIRPLWSALPEDVAIGFEVLLAVGVAALCYLATIRNDGHAQTVVSNCETLILWLVGFTGLTMVIVHFFGWDGSPYWRSDAQRNWDPARFEPKLSTFGILLPVLVAGAFGTYLSLIVKD